MGKKLHYEIDISSLISTEEWNPEVKALLPPELILTQRTIYLSEDSTLVGQGGVNKGKLFKYHIQSDSILTYTPFIPKLNGVNEENRIGYLYKGEMVVNQEQGKIAVVSDHFQQLEFYDFDLNLLKVTKFQKNYGIIGEFEQGKRFNSTAETKEYYNDIDFNNQYIFVLYENRSRKEIREGMCKESASEIHVYDWNGKPTTRYLLDDCPYRIAYDHINDRIIGVFPFTSEIEGLIKYYQL